MTEKQQMMSELAGNVWRRFECCILNAKIVWSSNNFKKHWSARVTDEFSSETLTLRKRSSSLYTKCVQFSLWPCLLFCTCYAGEMMIPCQVPIFSESNMNIFLEPFGAIFIWAISRNDSEGFTDPHFKLKWNLKSLQNELWKCWNLAWYHHFTRIACAKE